MITLILVVSALSIVEIRAMWNKKLKKEILVFSVLAVIALLLGGFYLSDPYRSGFADQITKLIGLGF